jgi:hypothetical protein
LPGLVGMEEGEGSVGGGGIAASSLFPKAQAAHFRAERELGLEIVAGSQSGANWCLPWSEFSIWRWSVAYDVSFSKEIDLFEQGAYTTVSRSTL